jgi:hypothetical protein
MDRKDDKAENPVTVEDGSEVVSKTIVGGRPRRRKTYTINIPAGIEKVLYLASTDRAFRARLLEDRSGAMADRGIRLTATETAVLGNVSDATLGHMIDQIRPRMHGRRKFMRAVAVAAVTLATGTAGVACEDDNPVPTDTMETFDSVGDVSDMPDDPQDLPVDVPEAVDVGGDVPDDPLDVQPDLPMDVTESFPDAGVEPDVPDVEDDDSGEEDAADVEEDTPED